MRTCNMTHTQRTHVHGETQTEGHTPNTDSLTHSLTLTLSLTYIHTRTPRETLWTHTHTTDHTLANAYTHPSTQTGTAQHTSMPHVSTRTFGRSCCCVRGSGCSSAFCQCTSRSRLRRNEKLEYALLLLHFTAWHRLRTREESQESPWGILHLFESSRVTDRDQGEPFWSFFLSVAAVALPLHVESSPLLQCT
jgi:hypothetical protein